MADALTKYLKSVEKELKAGHATEHTHRPALKDFIEALDSKVTATNEPKRVECGAPDYVVTRRPGPIILGYIECKDVGKSLDEADKSDQLKRYRRSLGNLLLTDYLEFRWYVDGQQRRAARLARERRGGKLVRDSDGAARVIELLKDFLIQEPLPISSPKVLAQQMARLTHIIRDIIVEAIEKDKASGLLCDLRKAFAETLIPDLNEPEKAGQFADMYAQTIAYGLFAARCNHQGPGPFRRLGAAAEIPKTNPFLRQLFETVTGAALDEEPYAPFVDDLVQVLACADLEAILSEFGKRGRGEDPVVHFYETFLATYDHKLRKARGVYYTPEPVVSYIVRSVDQLLKESFGMPLGLADSAVIEYERLEDGPEPKKVKDKCPRLLILDPACGTGTFLYAVVDLIRQYFVEHDQGGMWRGYVRKHLLKRVFGFELLMAPYAVAHFKLGMQLAGMDLAEEQRKHWAYDFSGDERLGIYLTNTLEEAERHVEDMFGPLRVITEEARAAAHVKRDLPIMVILGNPPYSNFGQMNKGPWISKLMRDWKPEGERKWNPDDFMKFIRWAQWRIERTGAGVLAFISNNAYIDGITHRKMRHSLMQTFDQIYILDLHGSGRKAENAPEGAPDENVFDIQQGVAIGIFVKQPNETGLGAVRHSEIWGNRDSKDYFLRRSDFASTEWNVLRPAPPHFFFVPKDFALAEEYMAGWSLLDVFGVNQNAIKTDRDMLFFEFDRHVLKDRIRRFYSPLGLEPGFRESYGVHDSSSYDLLARRQKTSFDESNIQRCLYRPFDWRWLYYRAGLTSRPAWKVMQHLLGHENVALIACRQFASYKYFTVNCTRTLTEISSQPYAPLNVFPLYLYHSAGKGQQALRGTAEPISSPPGKGARVPNFNPQYVANVEKHVGMTCVRRAQADLKTSFGPEQIFHYIYAVLHSPTYRDRYSEFLKIDFPRVPLTSNRLLFRKLWALGEEMVALHLLESPKLNELITKYPLPGDDTVAKRHPRYLPPGEPDPKTSKPLKQGRVYINKEQYFDGVAPDVWEFHIGGYQVCHKWLKDRRGRKLSSPEELEHYQKVVVALRETIRLMHRIDQAIDKHGGWPIR